MNFKFRLPLDCLAWSNNLNMYFKAVIDALTYEKEDRKQSSIKLTFIQK